MKSSWNDSNATSVSVTFVEIVGYALGKVTMTTTLPNFPTAVSFGCTNPPLLTLATFVPITTVYTVRGSSVKTRLDPSAYLTLETM